MTKLNEAYKEIITEKYEDLISVTIKAYDFDKMQDLVSKKLGFDINDSDAIAKKFFPDNKTFDDWCDSKGYGERDPKGVRRQNSQMWWNEYQLDIADGKWTEDIYADFWHWQLKNVFPQGVHNPSIVPLYVGMDESVVTFDFEWQKEIQKYGMICL